MGQDNKTIKKVSGNYCFPNLLGNFMRKISPRTQMEAEMASLFCILLGLSVMAVFTIFFTSQSIFVKSMVGFNCIAGFIFLSSRLTTSFQQYQQFLLAMDLLRGWNESTQELNMTSNDT